jgi:hypothetical protein
LACRESACEIIGGLERDASQPVAISRHRLKARFSGTDESELGGHEKSVDQDQPENGRYA